MNLVSFQIKSKCFIAGGVNRMPDSVSEARCYILFRVSCVVKKYFQESIQHFSEMLLRLKPSLLREFWSTKDTTNHSGHEVWSSRRCASCLNCEPIAFCIHNRVLSCPLSSAPHALASGNTTFRLLCSV